MEGKVYREFRLFVLAKDKNLVEDRSFKSVTTFLTGKNVESQTAVKSVFEALKVNSDLTKLQLSKITGCNINSIYHALNTHGKLGGIYPITKREEITPSGKSHTYSLEENPSSEIDKKIVALVPQVEKYLKEFMKNRKI